MKFNTVITHNGYDYYLTDEKTIYYKNSKSFVWDYYVNLSLPEFVKNELEITSGKHGFTIGNYLVTFWN